MEKKTIKGMSQIIVIILLGICFLYPDEVLIFSYSYLGKLVALLFVMIATCNNVVYGVFLCTLLILYYQSDMVEGMMLYESTTMVPIREESQVTTQNGEVVEKDNKSYKKKNEYDIFDFIVDPPDPDFVIDIENTGLEEHFSYTGRDDFRKKYCSSGHLRGDINERIFRHEFTDAIFPRFEFRFENRCNPCDPNCDFSFDKSS